MPSLVVLAPSNYTPYLGARCTCLGCARVAGLPLLLKLLVPLLSICILTPRLPCADRRAAIHYGRAGHLLAASLTFLCAFLGGADGHARCRLTAEGGAEMGQIWSELVPKRRNSCFSATLSLSLGGRGAFSGCVGVSVCWVLAQASSWKGAPCFFGPRDCTHLPRPDTSRLARSSSAFRYEIS